MVAPTFLSDVGALLRGPLEKGDLLTAGAATPFWLGVAAAGADWAGAGEAAGEEAGEGVVCVLIFEKSGLRDRVIGPEMNLAGIHRARVEGAGEDRWSA